MPSVCWPHLREVVTEGKSLPSTNQPIIAQAPPPHTYPHRVIRVHRYQIVFAVTQRHESDRRVQRGEGGHGAAAGGGEGRGGECVLHPGVQ